MQIVSRENFLISGLTEHIPKMGANISLDNMMPSAYPVIFTQSNSESIDQAIIDHAKEQLVDLILHPDPSLIIVRLTRGSDDHLLGHIISNDRVEKLLGYSKREIAYYAAECGKVTLEFRNREFVIAPFLWRIIDEEYWPLLAMEALNQFVEERMDSSNYLIPLVDRRGSRLLCRVSYRFVFSDSHDLYLILAAISTTLCL